MAGVTQTIDNYYGGISNQPDLKKFPGQVKDSVNAVPDIIEGLYKRPGSKRISPAEGQANHDAPLPNVQSNGSWFHYYRDETEGSYIGQIASDGKIRVWSCNDGVEKNVWYHTDNSAYNGSNSDHTSITTYLTPSSATATEDLQALTINDTTFLNNRTKTVASTGTTDANADSHFAYIELLRSENGRQYSLNIYNDPDPPYTVIKRATRLKIDSDTLDETDNHTGHCPGIGTQTFGHTETYAGRDTSVVDSGVKNLIFRITALGQQGSTNRSSNDNSPHYRCTYNRQVNLLHGGEGWETDDKTTVSLDQALVTFTYTVKVVDHEEVEIKANIKAVRPTPTPFDADTAVTPDTILGGITDELPNTISHKIIGNGIYLSSSSAFSVEVCDQDLMRVMQDTINSVENLPTQCKHGYIVNVANSASSDDDDYWLKFKGNDNIDGPGVWVECPKPGITKSLDATSMPHVLQRQADGDFLVKKYSWEDRVVGDDNTNPFPSFVGNTINKVLFFRNRLALLSGENVILSRPGELTTPSFFAKTALAVSAVDPIDISCSSTFPSDLFDGLEVAAGLAVFSTNQQFLLSSDAEILNPDTAKLRSISTYNYNKDIPPISLGTTIGYIDNSGKYSRFNEMANVAREQEPTVVETSKLVNTLLPKDIDLLTNSRENQLVFFSKTDSDILYGYKYMISGQERPQTSWFKWKLNNPIKYHFIIDDEYFFLDTDNFLQKINLMQQDNDPSIDENSVNYLIHLDNWTTVGSGSYSTTTKLTTFANQSDWIDQVTTPNGTLVLVDIDSNATRIGRYAECTVTNTDDFTVPGDWSTGTFYIGYLYEYSINFPTIYPVQSQNQQVRSDVNSSLVIHRVKLNFGKSGLYSTTLQRTGKDDYTETYESTFADEYLTSDAPYVPDQIQTIPVYEANNNVKLVLKSSHPAPATLYALSWEGDYSTKNYRRV